MNKRVGPRCKTCAHDNILSLNKDIRSGMALAEVARKYGLSYDSVRWHNEQKHWLLAMPTDKGVLVQVTDREGDIDAFLEMADVVDAAKGRYYTLVGQEAKDDVMSKHTTQALDLWRKATVDYLEKVAKIQGKTDIQVSVVMPVLLQIFNQFPPKLKKAAIDVLAELEERGKFIEVQIEKEI